MVVCLEVKRGHVCVDGYVQRLTEARMEIGWVNWKGKRRMLCTLVATLG